MRDNPVYTMTVTALVPSCVNSTMTLDRVRTRVVTIVVRGLLFLVMSVICVCGSEVTGQRLRQFLTILAFISRAQLNDRQVKPHHTKVYFEKLHPVHKGAALSKQKPTTGQKEIGRVHSSLQPLRNLGSCANLCYHDFAKVTPKTCMHE